MLLNSDRLRLHPDPILDAADSYRGTIIDLDHAHVVHHADLWKACDLICRELGQCGMHRGDRVIMAIANGPLFVATLMAVLKGGGSPLLLHAKSPPAELKRAALRYGARLILNEEWNASPTGTAFNDATIIGGDQSWFRLPVLEVDDRAVEFEGRFPTLESVPLHPTSGTTGVPKIAVRAGEPAVAEAAHYVETIGIDRHDTLLAAAPMSHAYAYGMCVMVPLISGANIVTMRSFKRKLVFQAFKDYDVTIFPAVPAMLDTLLFGSGSRLQSPARCVLSAGAPLPKRTADRFQQLSGMPVRTLYGTTETGGISVADADADTAFGASVGRPMNGVGVSIANDSGTEGLEGNIGRLFIQSSSMMNGYLSHDGIDTASMNDGWFDTGDLAHLATDGTIHLSGRESDVINVAGMKVIPGEVEEVIAMLPEVTEVKVYAGRRRSGAQFVKVAVAGTADLSQDKIRAHCDTELVYYKRPHTITLLDALPRSPAGKIVRDRLP